MDKAARLLVVDDEEPNRDMLKRRLERSGFAVEAAEGGRQALEAIDTTGFDLVLLDSMMPGMSGIEVLKLLRAVHSPDELPVIMVTAVQESEKIAEALDLGANDYITKPVDYQVTLARVRSQLSRRKAEQALRASQERYALAAEGANDGLWDWDLETGRVYFSPRWKSLLGFEENAIGSSPEEWFGRVHPEDRSTLEAALEEHLRERAEAFECEYRMVHKDGTCRWMLSRGLAVRDRQGRPVRMAGSQSDITAKKTTDPLTGLPNRIYLVEAISAALARARRDPKYNFAVMFLDLDRFKLINDSLGHLAGDEVLIEMARRLRESLRMQGNGLRGEDSDVAARLGGDEFAVLLPGAGSVDLVAAIAERFLRVLRPSFAVGGKPVFCTASIGAAIRQADHERAEDILRDADTAMYNAKSEGRARWALFDRAMRERVQARLEIENDLRWAVEKGQFVVYYQPRVSLDTGDICGFEALVRWNHPERGIIPPSDFIRLAEETGSIQEIGMFVLAEACRQMKEWQARFPQIPPLDISVNLSPRQCREPDLVARVAAVLAETGLAPSSLQLEVTESLLFENLDEARAVLTRLKSLGVGLKIDDFGTGYSSLRYLCELPFDSLKIDRSFTFGLSEDDHESEGLVKAILSLAGNLSLEVIAEGVENQKQVDRLRMAGCHFGQGYYYSRPVDATSAEKLLTAGTACPGEAL